MDLVDPMDPVDLNLPVVLKDLVALINPVGLSGKYVRPEIRASGVVVFCYRNLKLRDGGSVESIWFTQEAFWFLNQR